MKIWTIVTPENEWEIEVADCTLLYGQQLIWNRLIRQVDDFFNSRNSPIKIFEGSVPINKKDWNCFFIPFDADVHLSKITANSPLKKVQYEITEQLTYSPLYQELIEIWDLLDEEFELINQRLRKWGVEAKLNHINEKTLSNQVFFKSITGNNLSPIEVKTLLLNIILEKPLEKKTLVIVELPELFADDVQLQNFYKLVEKAIAHGYKFLLVSERESFGSKNYFYKERIIHSALLEQMKSKIRNEVPFYCTEKLYDQAVDVFFNLVDNSISEADLLNLEISNWGEIITIIQVIMYNLDMKGIQVPQGLEPNLKRFISDLR